MSAEKKKSDGPGIEEEALAKVKLELDGRGVDWFLQRLVTMVNVSEEFEFGITLHVDGAIISGNIISAKRYFTEFAKSFSGEPKPGEESWLYDWIIAQADIYKVDEDATILPPPNYLHLRDARVHSAAGSVPTNDGVLWRGRVSAVSGFNLGLLTSNSSN